MSKADEDHQAAFHAKYGPSGTHSGPARQPVQAGGGASVNVREYFGRWETYTYADGTSSVTLDGRNVAYIRTPLAQEVARTMDAYEALRAERDRLIEALSLAQATIMRLEPVHPGGFSSCSGTLDVIRAALEGRDA